MNRLSLLFVLSLLLVWACSPVDDLAPESTPGDPVIRAYIGALEEGQPVLTKEKVCLEGAFVDTYALQSASNFRIEKNSVGYFLRGECQVDDFSKATFAIHLDLDQGNNLSFSPSSSTQSCTSSTGCKGCKLTTVDENSGYCDCIASDVYVDPSRGRCIHSVTVSIAPEKQGRDGNDLTELIRRINS